MTFKRERVCDVPNPYHDPSNGQFTTATGVGIAAKQHAAHALRQYRAQENNSTKQSGPTDTAKSIETRLPTDEVMSYFHSVIKREDVTDAFVADVKANGVQKPIEIVTDGTKAAIADGHHRAISALHAGVKDVPVKIYRVSSEAMMGGRGDIIRGSLAKAIQPMFG